MPDSSMDPVAGATGLVNASTGWSNVLEGCNTVVHLGAHVHVMRESPITIDEALKRTADDFFQKLRG